MAAPRIAICFFGITRSLSHSHGSIEANVLEPARAVGETRVFAHFFRQEHIYNPRTSEIGELDPDEYRLIGPDELELEEPESCLEEWAFDRIAACGDTWKDGHKSVRNLVHQLHSLQRVTTMAGAWEPDLWIFARPDLRYHDSLARVFASAQAGPSETAWLPLWQSRGGHNDRFAIVRGQRVAHKYGRRAERMLEFCAATGQPLHAERLLGFVLRGERVRRISTRASRVRSTGNEAWECFSFQPLERMHVSLEQSALPHLTKRIGHRGLRALQDLVGLPFP